MATITAADLSVDVNDSKLLELAAARWMEYGCFVVRGLNLEYCADIAAQVRLAQFTCTFFSFSVLSLHIFFSSPVRLIVQVAWQQWV